MHELFYQMMTRLRWCGVLALSIKDRLKQTMIEHEKIYRAFFEGNQRELARAIGEHIETVKKNVKDIGVDLSLQQKSKTR
jgi:DNA-binding FadR family transcriptional regulator